jgi:hypothetical protein
MPADATFDFSPPPPPYWEVYVSAEARPLWDRFSSGATRDMDYDTLRNERPGLSRLNGGNRPGGSGGVPPKKSATPLP